MVKKLLLIFVFLILVFTTDCKTKNTITTPQDTITITLTPKPPTIPATPSVTLVSTTAPGRTATSTLVIPTTTPTSTPTLTSTSTPSFTPVSTPTKTIVPGDLVTDPDMDCQLVPESEIRTNPAEAVYLSGKFYLCRQWPAGIFKALVDYDLDSGQVVSQDDTQGDVEYCFSYASLTNIVDYFLLEINGATLYENTDNSQPTYSDCQQIVTHSKRGYLLDAYKGSEACFVTNEGRLAYIRIERINPYGRESIEIFFITWEER